MIEPIFILYALFLALLLFFRESRTKAFIIYLTFLVIFIMSETGADYEMYGLYYERERAMKEPIYDFFAFSAHRLGMPYDVFRLLWIGTFLALFCYSLCKMSPNFTISFLLFYLGFILYPVSIYRQFAAMAIMFWCFYQLYFKKRAILPLIGGYIIKEMHKSGFYVFFWIIFWAVLRIILFIIEKITKKEVAVEKAYQKINVLFAFCGMPLVIIALIVRHPIYYLSWREPFYSFLNNIMTPTYSGRTLISKGVLSRAVSLFAFMLAFFLMRKHRMDKQFSPIFYFYFVSIFGYMIVPFELAAGRMFNYGRLFEILLIPYMFTALKKYDENRLHVLIEKKTDGKLFYLSKANIFLAGMFLIYIAMFISQFLNTSGYYPYVNTFTRIFESIFMGGK